MFGTVFWPRRSTSMEPVAINSLEGSAPRRALHPRGGKPTLLKVFLDHRQRLRRMVSVRMDRRVARRIDPSDVLQEVYLDASRQWEGYLADPPMSLSIWLRFLTSQRLMALHRRHLGAQKRDARQEVALDRCPTRSADSASALEPAAAAMTSPSRAAIRGEIQAGLQRLLDQMTPGDREILVLRHHEQLTNQQAAEVLGISVAAASKRYIRALERLRSAMAAAPG